jgi:hypothetical protein
MRYFKEEATEVRSTSRQEEQAALSMSSQDIIGEETPLIER